MRARPSWLHALVGLLFFTGLVPVAAAVQGSGGGSEPTSSPEPRVAARNLIAAQEEQRRWRTTAEGRAELRRSASAFKGLSGDAAIRLLTQTFPSMNRRAWHAPPLKDARYEQQGLSYSAVIPGDGAEANRVVESTLPLTVEGKDGQPRSLDLSLDATGEGYAARVPLTSFTLPKRPQDGVRFDGSGLAVAPLGAVATAPQAVENGRVMWANAATDTDVVVGVLPAGAEWSWHLRSQDSPEHLDLGFALPDGARLERAPGMQHGFRVMRGGEEVAAVSPPVAWDADGEPVATSAEIDGDQLRIQVAHRDAEVHYPVLVDPTVSESQQFWISNGQIDFDGWWYDNWGNVFHSYDGSWGRGLYLFTWQGNWVSHTQHGSWRFYAPGDSRVVEAHYNYVNHSHPPTPGNGVSCVTMGISAGESWQNYHLTCDQFGGGNWAIGHAGSAGNHARFQYWIYAPAYAYPAGYDPGGFGGGFFGGAYTVLADDIAPSESSHGAVPSGWVRTATLGATARDSGLGIQRINATAPTSHPGWAGHPMTNPCSAPRPQRCPPAWTTSFSSDKLPEGVVALRLDGQDRAGNVRSSAIATVRVDRTAPTATLSGGLWDARDNNVAPADYSLQVQGTDALSGVAKVAYELRPQGTATVVRSGQQVRGGCTQTGCGSSPFGHTFVVDFEGLANGVYDVAASVIDQAGNVKLTQFQVALAGYQPEGPDAVDEDDPADAEQDPDVSAPATPTLTAQQQSQARSIMAADPTLSGVLAGVQSQEIEIGPWTEASAVSGTETLVGASVILQLGGPSDWPMSNWPQVSYTPGNPAYAPMVERFAVDDATELMVDIDLRTSRVIGISPMGGTFTPAAPITGPFVWEGL